MIALTINQPYAHLIVTPRSELPPGAEPKRVENRSWRTACRGNVLIHAGLSLKWMNPSAWPKMPDRRPLRRIDFPEMAFGAIVGVARLIAVLDHREVERGAVDDVPGLEFVRTHAHTEGPFCWVFDRVRRFAEPIPYLGRQGLFFVPESAIAGVGLEPIG